jgi:hypothetical protein
MINKIETAVAFFVWIRPEETKKVFEEIKKIQPDKLYLISDGPRNSEDKKLNNEVKKIVEDIDWTCDVKKNYSETNMGCKKRISSGIDWVFETEERAIILEDDCLPSQSFFYFCDELLEKYKNDHEITMISGNNFQQKNQKFTCDVDYYYSRIGNIWGWATWKRSWQKYDVDIKKWPEIKNSKILKKIFPNYSITEYWTHLLDEIYKNKAPKTGTWDAQWFLTTLLSGIAIIPAKNLVSNIGFGNRSTHGGQKGNKLENLPKYDLNFPLKHPEKVEINNKVDLYTYKFIFRINDTTKKKIKSFLRQYFGFLYFPVKKILKKINKKK